MKPTGCRPKSRLDNTSHCATLSKSVYSTPFRRFRNKLNRYSTALLCSTPFRRIDKRDRTRSLFLLGFVRFGFSPAAHHVAGCRALPPCRRFSARRRRTFSGHGFTGYPHHTARPAKKKQRQSGHTPYAPLVSALCTEKQRQTLAAQGFQCAAPMSGAFWQ